MYYKSFVEAPDHLSGHIAILYANDEKMIAVVAKLLKETKARITLYNLEDTTAFIQSFGLTSEQMSRLDLRVYEDENAMFTACAQELEMGKADVLMKGNMMSSAILSFILKNKSFLQDTKFLNHIACFDIPNYHKMLMISDVALNIAPTVDEKIKMIGNIEQFSQKLGYDTLNIAMLSSVEKVTEQLQSSVDAAAVVAHFESQASTSLHVDGPFAFDNVISKESALQKNITSEVAGDADVIIVPQIDTGNVLYKSLTYLAGAHVASLILGAKFPIVLTSRADKIENKFDSALLALRMIQ